MLQTANMMDQLLENGIEYKMKTAKTRQIQSISKNAKCGRSVTYESVSLEEEKFQLIF